jgi:Fe-S cluster assembly iron-binding protein IscA
MITKVEEYMTEEEKRKTALELAIKMAGCPDYAKTTESRVQEKQFSKMVIADAKSIYQYLFEKS